MKRTGEPRKHWSPTFYWPILLLGVILIFSGCISGQSFSLSLETEKSEGSEAAHIPQEAEENGKTPDSPTITIKTQPTGAEVWVQGEYQGKSPVSISRPSSGFIEIISHFPDYHTNISVLSASSLEDEITLHLQPITGYIVINPEELPDIGLVNNSTRIENFNFSTVRNQYTIELPIGTTEIRFRKFGFHDIVQRLTIKNNEYTGVTLPWRIIPFAISGFRVSPRLFSPISPGSSGQIHFHWETVAPGRGQIAILDSQENQVFFSGEMEFETWKQSLSWNGHLDSGEPVPDGTYTSILKAEGRDGRSQETSLTFIIDRRATVYPRSVSVGSVSGLLLVPTTDVLSSGNFHLGFGAEAIWTPEQYRIPAGASIRLGVSPYSEFNFWISGIFREDPIATSYQGGGAIKSMILYRNGRFGTATLGTSFGFSIRSYISGPGSSSLDHDTHFPGISGGIFGQWRLGLLGIHGGGELKLNTTTPEFSTQTPEGKLGSWAYFRGGLSLNTRKTTMGISGAMRTDTFGYSDRFIVPQGWFAGEIMFHPDISDTSYGLFTRFSLIPQPAGTIGYIGYGGFTVVFRP